MIVRGGTYRENVVFPGTNFHLRSVDPNDPEVVEGTVIQGVPVPGETYYSVLTFNGTETPDFVVEGLAITGGYGFRGGAAGGNNTHGTLQSHLFRTNVAHISGGALSECDGLINGNRFVSNRADSSGGALSDCNGDIGSNLFMGNVALGGGAAVGCDRGQFRANVVKLNRAIGGGAFDECNADFYSNLIYLNTATSVGSSFSFCNGEILNNTLYENGGGSEACMNAETRQS